MVTYHLHRSGTVRLFITLDKNRYRITISKFKVDHSKWMNQRVVGKNSVLINQELDRIADEIEKWSKFNPTHVYTKDQISKRINQIISNSETIEKRKTITEYFEEYLNEKRVEVNRNTNKLNKPATIRSYETGFNHFKTFGLLELEQIDKKSYNAFLNFLLKDHKPNTAGKNIRRMKAFFNWCDQNGLPINREYRFWKAITEETEEETRALNLKQLNKLYELVIDPIDIYEIAKKKHGKKLDAKHIQQITASVDEARKQAIAMASIGAHKEDFWKLTDANIIGGLVKYKRGKNNLQCVAPFLDNDIFHATEFANLKGGVLFKRMAGKFNYYLSYIEEIIEFPFHITAKTFRKTFGSIIWYESGHPNRLGIIMKAYGHKKELTTRRYLGIQDEDLEQDHAELFNF